MDFYRAPSFQFYQDDFVSGTCDLATEEVGAYVLLLAQCWNKGGIPNDVNRIAQIARLSPQRMAKIWNHLRSKFSVSPHDRNLLSNRRLEMTRSQAAEHAELARQRGRRGASARWNNDAQALPKHSSSNAQKMPEGMLADGSPSPIPSPPPVITAAAKDSDTSSRAHVGDGPDRATESDPLQFGRWFLARGIELGLIGEHHGLDPFAWAFKHSRDAEPLLDTYGDEKCRERAERLFQAVRDRKIRGSVSIARLASTWDWAELQDATAGGETAAQKYRRTVRGEGAA